MINLDFEKDTFLNNKPFPNILVDNVLDNCLALDIKNEIVNIPQTEFDRYSNPFEQKWTLRNKNNLPQKCRELFEYLHSDEFVNKLSEKVGIKLINDPNKNFWGIHIFENGDKLDIHVDAGIHPITKQKKEITLGIYLSDNWKSEYGGELELWEGNNSKDNDAKITRCVVKAEPLFNRMVIFQCNDYSWHGSSNPVVCPDNAKRIFLTISYLSDRQLESNFENKRQKAFFVALPDEPKNEEKDKLRLMRADPEKYKEVYKCM